MNRTPIETRVRAIVAETARISAATIDMARWLPDHGIDSLQLLVIRETLESAFSVHIPDGDWLDIDSLASLVTFLEQAAPGRGDAEGRDKPRLRGSETAGRDQLGPDGSRAETHVAPELQMFGGARLDPRSGLLYEDVEIGMPLTGLMNLAEGPLLQRLGDHRWRHLSGLMGVPSKAITDDEGERLYPTFFYVEVAFPPARPMASWGENDRVRVVSEVRRFGGSMVDGVSCLMPEGHDAGGAAPFADVASAVAAGVPAVRLSNIFVRQFGGAEWLMKSRPRSEAFARIPETTEPPDSYRLVKDAEQKGSFVRAPAGFVPMTNGPVRRQYRLVPDRDLNGARLVYFANYPVFLDVCEREVLASASLPLAVDHIDRRTLVSRRSAYLNNASWRDSIVVDVEPWIENPWATGHPEPEAAPVRLLVNCRMYRQSDDRLMMVATAEKLLADTPAGETALLARLSGAGGRGRP